MACPLVLIDTLESGIGLPFAVGQVIELVGGGLMYEYCSDSSGG